MKAWHYGLVASAFFLCSGFTADGAGRACVQQKGERGTAYNVDKTKMKEAYTPNGRRMLQDGQRIYEVEVPGLLKRDKPIFCTLSMANGMWQAAGPGVFERNPFAVGNSPFTAHERIERDPDIIARERRERGLR